MSTNRDKLAETQRQAHQQVTDLVALSLAAKSDDASCEQLRGKIAKWVASVTPDTLNHFALFMVGFGQRWVTEMRGELSNADGLTQEQRNKLTSTIDEAAARVTNIARVSLLAERDYIHVAELESEITNWVAVASSDVLGYFAANMIGTGVAFAHYVDQRIAELGE